MSERVRVGGVPIDPLRMEEALDAIDRLVAEKRGGAVFTPNVDHVVEYDENPSLREAYESASLSLVDGMPILWAGRVFGVHLPERVAGSDLVMPLARRAEERGWRVFLLGGGEGIADRAKVELEKMLPGIKVVGTLAPRVDMKEPREARDAIREAVKKAAPDVVVVGFGAPKQELFIHESKDALAPAVLLGLGASIDFLAGAIPRAPTWMAKHGLEWFYRFSREPKRLWRRYFLKDPKFFWIVWKKRGGG